MGKNKSFVTIWDSEDSKPLQTSLDKGNEEEIVSDGDVEEIDQEIEDEEEEKDNGEETDTEEVDEKQDEDEEESEEDASSGSGYGELIQSLVDEDIVAFDPEKEYDLSEEGLIELIQDTADAARKEGAEDYKKSLGESSLKLIELLEKGLTVDDYVAMQQQIDFTKVDVNNPVNQEYLVEDWLKAQGHTKEEVEDTIEQYKEAGILDKQAKIAQKKLGEWQAKENEKLIATKAKEKADALKAEEDAATEFKETVLGLKEIAGFEITKKQAAQLYDYITKPGKNGKTSFQSDDTLEKRMLYAYMSMIGFDKTALAKEVSTKQAIKLKKTLSNHTDSFAKSGGAQIRRDTGEKPKIHWNFGAE